MEESETAVQEKGRWLNYEDGRALRGFLTVNYSEIGDVPRVSASATSAFRLRPPKVEGILEKQFGSMKSNPAGHLVNFSY